MPSGVYVWDETPADNANIDDNINWVESQAAASINNSARAMMAEIAKWVRDQSGYNVTTGAANTYSVVLRSTNPTLANGVAFAAEINATNTGASTMLGKKIYKASGGAVVALDASDLVATGHYVFQYNEDLDSSAGGFMCLNPSGISGALTSVMEDTSPVLGGDFDVEDFNFVDGDGNEFLSFTAVNSAVNYVGITSSISGVAPSFKAAGDDTNIDLVLDGKGTGRLKDAAGNNYLIDGEAANTNITRIAITGDGSTTTWDLGVTPASENAVIVEIGGVIQETTEYTISGDDLVFGTAPASGITGEARVITTASSSVVPADGSVNGPKLASSSVTTDKLNIPTLVSLAGLSLVAGDILYCTGANTLARLPKGTAGQAVVMNAGATAPVFATVASVNPFNDDWQFMDHADRLSTWVSLASWAHSTNVTEVEIAVDMSGYADLLIHYVGVVADTTNNDIKRATVSYNDGTDYSSAITSFGQSTTTTGAVTGAAIVYGAGRQSFGNMCAFSGQEVGASDVVTNSITGITNLDCNQATAGDVNKVRFYGSQTADFTDGAVTLYGRV